MNTTLAKQLALYVVLYSPLQMAADLPENYLAHPDAFQFIRDVPTDWDDTRVLNARIGDYVTIVRKERGGDDWYLGSVTDEVGRTLEVPLSFLDRDRRYVAEIYRDADDADWKTNPTAYKIERARSRRQHGPPAAARPRRRRGDSLPARRRLNSRRRPVAHSTVAPVASR